MLWWVVVAGVAAASGPVSLQVSGPAAQRPRVVTLVCEGHKGETVSGSAGRFRLAALPDAPPETCLARFGGGAEFSPLVAGLHYDCILKAGAAYCRAVGPALSPPAVDPAVSVKTQDAGEGAGTATVRLARTDLATWGLVECPQGPRLRAGFVDGVARFEGVPETGCVLHFKGSTPGKHAGFAAGDVLVCDRKGDFVACRDVDPVPTSTPSAVGRATVSKGAPPPPAEAEVGTLQVQLSDVSAATWGMLSCPGGASSRARFERGLAVFEGVPDEPCTLWFKGGAPAKFVGLTSGQAVTCSVTGLQASCR